MSTHRFRPGQSVYYCPAASQHAALRGSYEVIKQMPERDDPSILGVLLNRSDTRDVQRLGWRSRKSVIDRPS